MANVTIDVGKEGMQGYKTLQTLIDGDKENTKLQDSLDTTKETEEDKFSIDNVLNHLTSLDDNISMSRESNASSFYSPDDWGKSRYDVNTLGESSYNERFDIRAENQPWYAKIGSGVAKMGILAVTTFVDGIVGTPAGLINIFVEGTSGNLQSAQDTKKAFVVNPLSEFLQSINESSESWLPNYYTQEEIQNNESGQWYRNIASANFIGDHFLKNIGFTIGAAASAVLSSGAASKLLVNKGLREAFKGTVYKAVKEEGTEVLKKGAALKTGKEVYNAMKNGETLLTKSGEVIKEGTKLSKDLQKAAKQLKAAEWNLKLFGSVNSAMGEGRIEAINSVKEFEDKEYENINAWANNAMTDIKYALYKEHKEWFDDNGEIINPLGIQEFNERTKDIRNQRDALLAETAKKGADVANYVFLSNVALLSFSNFVQFGRAMSGGFTTANNFKDLIKPVVSKEFIKENGKNAAKKLTKKLGQEGVEAGVNKLSMAKQYGRAILNPFTEGFEELNQGVFAKGAYLKSASELNQYANSLLQGSIYADTIDKEANNHAIGYLNSFIDGALQTYGKSQAWEEFSIGFVTGMLGIPTIGTRANGKKGLKMSGEFIEGLKDAKQKKKEANELVNKINARVNTQEMREYYKGLIRHTKGDKDKLDFLMKDDKFNYNNSDFKQLITDAIMFDKAGRLEDFYEMIEDYSKLTGDEKESLQTIISNSKYDVEEDGKKVLDADGKPVQRSMYEGYSVERMNEEVLKKRADKARKAVDYYVKNANALKSLYGDNISQDALVEMVYGLSQLDNWSDRSREMMSEISKALHSDVDLINNNTEGENVEIDEELLQSYQGLTDYLLSTGNKNLLNILGVKVLKGKLTDDELKNAFELLQRGEQLKSKLYSRGYKAFNKVETDRKNKITSLFLDADTDAFVKGNIIESLSNIFEENKDVLQFDNADLEKDFKNVLEEASKKIGAEALAEKLVEWNRYLSNVKKETQKWDNKTKKLVAKEVDKEKLIERLYEDIRREHEKKYEEKEEERVNIDKESKEKKNKIIENYKKKRKLLTDRDIKIRKRLLQNKNLTSFDIEKYSKMLDDLRSIAVARAYMLDKLMELSKHPERFTAEALALKNNIQEEAKKVKSYALAEELNKCVSIKELDEVLYKNEIETSDDLKNFIKDIKDFLNDNTLEMINNISNIREFRDIFSKVSSSVLSNNEEAEKEILNVVKTIEDKLFNTANDFDSLYTKFTSDDLAEYLKLETDVEKNILDEIKKDTITAYEAAKNKSKSSEDSEVKGVDETQENETEDTPSKSPIEEAMEGLNNPEVINQDEEEPAPVPNDNITNKSVEELEKEKDASKDNKEKELLDKVISAKKASNDGLYKYSKNGNYVGSDGRLNLEQPSNIPANKKDIGNSIAEEETEDGYKGDESSFTNSSITEFSLYSSKLNILQPYTPESSDSQNLKDFLTEYNAYSFVDEGFLSEVKVDENSQNIPVYFFTVQGLEYGPEDKRRNFILTAVKVNKELKNKLKKRYGENLKLIEYTYESNGNTYTEYYQLIGTINCRKNLNYKLSEKEEDTYKEVLKNISSKDDGGNAKNLEERIDIITTALNNTDDNESALITALNDLLNRTIYSALEFDITNRGSLRKDTDSLIVYDGEASVDKGLSLNKSLNYHTEIKHIYTGRLVNATKEEGVSKEEKAERRNYDVASNEGHKNFSNGNLNITKSYNDSSDIKGQDFHLGIYYNNGTLHVPSLEGSDVVVPLSAKNDNRNSYAFKKNGKLIINNKSGGSLWVMVKMADGRYYPKSIVMKRFNSEEYPQELWARGKNNPIIDNFRNYLEILCDATNTNRKRALAKFAIKEEVLFIPSDYELLYNNNEVSLINKDSKEAVAVIDISDMQSTTRTPEEKKEELNRRIDNFLLDLNSKRELSFRFQVFNGALKSDRNGKYRQMLLDSNVMFTNIPILDNINSNVDLHRFSFNNKVLSEKQKVAKRQNAPKKLLDTTEKHQLIQHGESKYLAYISKDDIIQVLNDDGSKVTDNAIIANIKIQYILKNKTAIVKDQLEVKESTDGYVYYRLSYKDYNGYVYSLTSNNTDTTKLNLREDIDWDSIEVKTPEERAMKQEASQPSNDTNNGLTPEEEARYAAQYNSANAGSQITIDFVPPEFSENLEKSVNPEDTQKESKKEEEEKGKLVGVTPRGRSRSNLTQPKSNKDNFDLEKAIKDLIKKEMGENHTYVEFLEWINTTYGYPSEAFPKAQQGGGMPANVLTEEDFNNKILKNLECAKSAPF